MGDHICSPEEEKEESLHAHHEQATETYPQAREQRKQSLTASALKSNRMPPPPRIDATIASEFLYLNHPNLSLN
jgi:hypothetical protein